MKAGGYGPPAPVAVLQWLIFGLVNLIPVPVVIGHAFGFSGVATAELLQRTLIVAGVVSLAQVYLGHRLPVLEGSSGLWVSVALALAAVAASSHLPPLTLWAAFRGGLIVAGVILALLTVLRGVSRLKQLFSQATTGVYLTLLAVQLIAALVPVFVFAGGRFDLASAGLGVLIIVLVLVLARLGPMALRSYALLIGVAVGWVGYRLLPLPLSAGPGVIGSWWPFVANGGIAFQLSVVAVCVIAGLINTTNTVATLHAMEQVAGRAEGADAIQPADHDRANLVTAAGNLLAGASGVVGVISLSSSAALARLGGGTSRRTFALASVILVAIGFVPAVVDRLALLPAAVGAAVLAVLAIEIAMIGLVSLGRGRRQGAGRRIGCALVVGLGIMVFGPALLAPLGASGRILLGNGLVMGVVVALALEAVAARRLPAGS